MAESLANPLNITRDDIGGSGRVLRISMHRLHPELGKVQRNAWVYGIRNVQALRNRVSLSIVECKIASQSKDSRDKWFRIPVHYFDTSVAELAQRAREILKSNLLSVESSAGRIESDLSGISQCRDDFKSMDLSLDSILLQTLPSLSTRLRDLDHHKSSNPSRTTIHPGRSIDNPARSCRSAMGREMEKGFYWIDSVCQSDILRMWCDGPSSGYYVYNDSSTLSDRRYQQNVFGVEFLCGSVGLYPVTVKSSHQIRSLMTMLSQQDVEIPESSAIPLAFDLDGRFRELGSMTDVTGIVQRFITASADSAAASNSGNAVGFTSINSVSEIDWRGGKLAGLICSTKPSEHEFVAKLDCNSVVSGNKIFQGGLNTNFRVGCPSDCPSMTIYGGFEFVYSDNSSLCQAAIHSGLDFREFNVILETVHESYPSIFRNGVQSSPLNSVKSSLYAVRLGPPFHGCPFDENFGAEAGVVPQQNEEFVSSSNLTSAFVKLKMGGNLHSDKSTSFSAPINDLTHAVTNATLQDTRYSIPIDKMALDALRSNLMRVLSNGRSLIKPIESLSNKLNAESVNLFSRTNRFGDKISAVVSERLTEVEDVTRRSEQFKRRTIFLTGFEDWDVSKFPDTREVSTMFDLWNKGSSSWNLVSNSKAVILTQTGRVVAAEGEPFTSPVLALKSKRFYDFQYHVHIMIEQENNIGGILFRVQNSYNFYMLTVKKRNQSEFEFKLFRVEYGMIFPLMKNGLIIPIIDDVWIDVSIECRRGKITIIVQNIYTVFSAIDEFLVSGTVGFTVLQATTGGVIAYDFKSVKALCCESVSQRNEGPLPPECSFYQDPQYQGAFKKSFHTVVTQTASGAAREKIYDIENWDYTRSVAGRLQAIATRNVPINLINMAILNRGFCSDGIISFDFSAKNCDNDGRLGIVYQ